MTSILIDGVPPPGYCACGRLLHYSNAETRRQVQSLVNLLGPLIKVNTPYGSWLVPRHYIGLHGIVARELPEVAERLGFARAASSEGGVRSD